MIYTQEEQDFFREFVRGHSWKQIQEEFFKRFDKYISLIQIKGYIQRNGLNTDRENRFEKGHVPHNKGLKGYYSAGIEKGWFKKGHTPLNYKPVGSERINVDGYIEIKVKDPNKWKLKHRYLWEKHNGKIPKGMILIFKDNNKLNVCLDNLILISRAENMEINRRNDCKFTGDSKEAIINLTRLKLETRKVKRKRGA